MPNRVHFVKAKSSVQPMSPDKIIVTADTDEVEVLVTSPPGIVIQPAIGTMGPEGPQGIVGPPGATGPMGPQGVEGPQGSDGPIGPEGPTGPMGPEGPSGESAFMTGHGPPDPAWGMEGTIYLDEDTGEFWGPKGMPSDIILGGDDFERPGTDTPPSASWVQMTGTKTQPLGLAGDGHSVKAYPDWGYSGAVFVETEILDDVVDVVATLGNCPPQDGNDAFQLFACISGTTPLPPNGAISLVFNDDGQVRVFGMNSSGQAYLYLDPVLVTGDRVMSRIIRSQNLVEFWLCRLADGVWTLMQSWDQTAYGGMPPGARVGLSINDNYPPNGWTIEDFKFGHIVTEAGSPVWPSAPFAYAVMKPPTYRDLKGVHV